MMLLAQGKNQIFAFDVAGVHSLTFSSQIQH
jgi:hypothetical protein